MMTMSIETYSVTWGNFKENNFQNVSDTDVLLVKKVEPAIFTNK